jgi:hypothetical protein
VWDVAVVKQTDGGEQVDQDNSGLIDPDELRNALAAAGDKFEPQAGAIFPLFSPPLSDAQV